MKIIMSLGRIDIDGDEYTYALKCNVVKVGTKVEGYEKIVIYHQEIYIPENFVNDNCKRVFMDDDWRNMRGD